MVGACLIGALGFPEKFDTLEGLEDLNTKCTIKYLRN